MCSNIIAVASDSTTPGRIESMRFRIHPICQQHSEQACRGQLCWKRMRLGNLSRAPAIEDIAIMDPPDVLIVSAAA